jgi:hypothetical protein
MHLEVLVRAVAKELLAAGPEVSEPGDELFGRRGGGLMHVDRGHMCSLLKDARPQWERPSDLGIDRYQGLIATGASVWCHDELNGEIVSRRVDAEMALSVMVGSL